MCARVSEESLLTQNKHGVRKIFFSPEEKGTKGTIYKTTSNRTKYQYYKIRANKFFVCVRVLRYPEKPRQAGKKKFVSKKSFFQNVLAEPGS